MKKTILNYLTCFLALFLFAATASIGQDKGVLILAHGGSEEWNQNIIEAAEPLSEDYRVEVAFGMANYVSMSKGITKLEKQGVSEIAVIPLFVSSYSLIIRQTEYLLGKRDTLNRLMPVMHHVQEFKEMMGIQKEPKHSGHSSGGHQFYMPEHLPQIPVKAAITITSALDDHPVVAKILHQRIQALSESPAKETILLVAHGPTNESDNKKWVLTMESLARKIRDLQKETGTAYKQIFSLTVRDDANDAIYNQAKAQLRTLVRQAGRNGRVIVIPLFLSSGGREQAVAERLKGLDFAWSGRTLLPDPLITDFLWQSADKAFIGN
jgi:sirohydrochlorin ferrochelatase